MGDSGAAGQEAEVVLVQPGGPDAQPHEGMCTLTYIQCTIKLAHWCDAHIHIAVHTPVHIFAHTCTQAHLYTHTRTVSIHIHSALMHSWLTCTLPPFASSQIE